MASLVLTAYVAALGHTDGAQAQCSGTYCLPGPGYTFDKYWNCGLTYSAQNCFDPGNCLGLSCANVRMIGWASADYDGAGSVPLGVIALCYDCTTSDGDWSGSGINLARACRYTDCRRNTTRSYQTTVQHYSGGQTRHTIYGHSKG